jgi:hypothetical protein
VCSPGWLSAPGAISDPEGPTGGPALEQLLDERREAANRRPGCVGGVGRNPLRARGRREVATDSRMERLLACDELDEALARQVTAEALLVVIHVLAVSG